MWPNDRMRATCDVLRLPDVRRIELGWGASVIGELASQLTLVVYAFDAGGAVLVAAYVASRTLHRSRWRWRLAFSACPPFHCRAWPSRIDLVPPLKVLSG